MLALPILLAAAVSSPDFPDLSCIQLAKGDGFAFHAVRTGYRSSVSLPPANPPRAKYGHENPYGSDSVASEEPWMVTHTDFRTGRMTKLFQGGGWYFRDGSPDIGRGLTTKTVRSFAPAFAADERHFYLLHVEQRSGGRGGHGADELTATLRVYRGGTGRLVTAYPVEGFALPKPSARSQLFAAFGLPSTSAETRMTRLDIADSRLTVGKTAFHTVDGVLLPVPKR